MNLMMILMIHPIVAGHSCTGADVCICNVGFSGALCNIHVGYFVSGATATKHGVFNGL
jgi:hypothetical protein